MSMNKTSTKILSLILSLVMAVGLLPTMSYAADPAPVEIVVGHTAGTVTKDDVQAAIKSAGLDDEDYGLLPFSATLAEGATSIGESAFSSTRLTGIVIPNTVTEIGDTAFFGSELVEVNIPDSVTYIGFQALSFIHELENISVDASNPNYCSENGVLFDKNKVSLIQYPERKEGTTYTIPNSVTSIEVTAFLSSSLTSIVIPERVTSIDWYSFAFCESLVSVSIQNRTAWISPYAFNYDSYENDKGEEVPLFHPNLTLHGYTNSTAYTLAIENGINFVPLADENPQPTPYAITVTGGIANPTTAVAGTFITITAIDIPTGKVFDKWVSADGVTFANASAATTTFTMPAKAVTVTATYKKAPTPDTNIKKPSITSVAVTPKTVSVQTGKTKQFTANVKVQNNAAKTVTWRVSGNKSKSTKISSKGKLTVAKNETAKKLTITATSTVDKSKVGRATVTVTKPRTPALTKKQVPTNKTVRKNSKIALKAPKSTVLYYTTNGKKPTLKTKTKVKAGRSVKIKIRKKTTLRVIAVKSGCTASKEVRRTYKVK